ncbi:MAG: EamA family transporter [Flavobacteriaceae bacterium]|nr:MAG: EamA family transporter [Flavobacteriaceae bacterium]
MKTQNRTLLYSLLGLLGLILFSLKAILVKIGYKEGAGSVDLLFLRMFFSLPFYLVIILVHLFKEGLLPLRLYGKMIFLGLIGYYLSSFFDFEGLRYVSASLERLILFVYPTFVLIFSAVLLKSKIYGYQKKAILFTYLGVLCLFLPVLLSEEKQDFAWIGVIYVFLASVFYALYLVGSQSLLQEISSNTYTAYVMFFSTLGVGIHFAFQTKPETLLKYPTSVYQIGAIMAFFCTVLPSFLISYCIQKIGASNFGVLASFGPLSTVILAYFILGETLGVYQILGGIIIVTSIVYLNLRQLKETQSKSN